MLSTRFLPEELNRLTGFKRQRGFSSPNQEPRLKKQRLLTPSPPSTPIIKSLYKPFRAAGATARLSGTSPTNQRSAPIPDRIYQQLKNAKKGILHLHVKGSTPLILLMLDRLKATDNIREIAPGEQLEQELSIHGHHCEKSEITGELMPQSSLNTYREQYAQLANIAKTPRGAFLTYYLLMKEQAAHGVRYVEFRTGLPDYNPETFIEHCVRGCQEAQRDLLKEHKRLDYGLIVLINRGGSTEQHASSQLPRNIDKALNLAQTAVSLRQQGYPIVGIDLAGDEAAHAVTDFAPVFRHIHNYNAQPTIQPEQRIGITIHAGETPSSKLRNQQLLSSYESVVSAVILASSPHTPLRIGHGVGIMQHPSLQKAFEDYLENPNCIDQAFITQLEQKVPLLTILKQRNVCLETCPKSNFQTGAVPNYRYHPVMFLDKIGLKVTVNPDNTIISKTDPTNEFVKLYKFQKSASNPQSASSMRNNTNTWLNEFLEFMDRCYRNAISTGFIFDSRQRQNILHDRHNQT